MIWNYSLTTNTIWLSFDYGQVIANSIDEAREKAIKQLRYDLDKANHVLASVDVTLSFKIEVDFTQLTVGPLEYGE